jgi:molybdenum ABC transporter molybdate-binding protein
MMGWFPRSGSIAPAWFALLGSAGALAVLIGLLAWDTKSQSTRDSEPLTIYCAAALRAPLEQIVQDYQKAYGVPVQLRYGGSNTLLSQIEVVQRGDLYLPADDAYTALAASKHLIAEALPLAHMNAVLAVRKSNPRHVRGLADLLEGRVRIAFADPDQAAIGKVVREALQKTGQWDRLKTKVTVFQPTVNEVANTIKVGAADVGVVWDATVRQYPALEAVAAPDLGARPGLVSVCLLRCSTQPTGALRFARYLAARDRGLPVLREHGFDPADGDAWSERPEIRLFAGAMLRPAIEETVQAFEEREGVRVTRVYNGCGILVAQMRAAAGAGGQEPDVYFACDQSFMSQVHDLFPDAVEVSTNQLVILVPKGNPQEVRSLKDLGKPGLRVGIGHEKQCAMGALTQETLAQAGFRSAVMKNVKVQSPTGDMLVNQLRTKTLDAVVAYISNAVGAADELEAIRLDIPCAIAVQPVAVGRATAYPQLNQRLVQALRSPDSKRRFEANGFHWRDGTR